MKKKPKPNIPIDDIHRDLKKHLNDLGYFMLANDHSLNETYVITNMGNKEKAIKMLEDFISNLKKSIKEDMVVETDINAVKSIKLKPGSSYYKHLKGDC